jgi:hypothetical protein
VATDEDLHVFLERSGLELGYGLRRMREQVAAALGGVVRPKAGMTKSITRSPPRD